jgi:YidC/Oxa1 family membrane protein insertase
VKALGLVLAASKKFWILDPLYAALGVVMAGFYAVIPSYGISIILLTVAVCILRMPLVAKQVTSQQEMQRIQPELKRIQAKYKSDPQKRNEELMKLYKEHNVNPFAGCLPLLLQMPLFIVLYRLILNLNHKPPKHIPNTTRLYHDLVAAGGKMHDFGMDLAQRASAVHGFGHVWPYLVLIFLVIITGMYQQRQMTSRLPKDAMTGQMAVMGKIFPLFLGFISYNISAGVVLYFIVSNLWQIGQQAVLFRRQAPAGAAASGGGGGGDGGGGGAGGGRGAGGGGGKPSEKGTPAAARAGKGGGLFARLARAASSASEARSDGKGSGAKGATGKASGSRDGRGSSSAKKPGPTSGARGNNSGRAKGQSGAGKAGSNGRGGGRAAGGAGGRAQGKGGAPGGSRSRPRNSRRGK